MLEDLAALMGDDVGGEGEWRSPYYSLGKRSEAEGRSKRFTVDFNGMQVGNDSFQSLLRSSSRLTLSRIQSRDHVQMMSANFWIE